MDHAGDPEVMRMMCPNLSCQRILAVPELARGKVVRCRSCGTNVRVPEGRDASTPRNMPDTAEDVA